MMDKECDDKCKFKPVHTERFFLYLFVIITMFNSCDIMSKLDSVHDILKQQETVEIRG